MERGGCLAARSRPIDGMGLIGAGAMRGRRNENRHGGHQAI
jgi:hypothetical protein